jgi:hypothetical protein
MKYSRKSLLFDNYFVAFKVVCYAIRERTYSTKGALARDYPHRELLTLLPGVLPIFLSLAKECPILNKLIIEIVQSLVIPFQVLIEYLPILIRPFTECIANSHPTGNAACSALKALESWLPKMSETPELLDILYDIVPELIPALYKLYCTPNVSPITSRMLASFGGRSKPYITEKEASTKS